MDFPPMAAGVPHPRDHLSAADLELSICCSCAWKNRASGVIFCLPIVGLQPRRRSSLCGAVPRRRASFSLLFSKALLLTVGAGSHPRLSV